jgi:hypothetical protein
MKYVYVPIVGKSLKQINTAKQSVAPNPVRIDFTRGSLKFAKIKSIRYIGKQDVYNMEVRGHHNFSVNGGLIVHNSIDAIRYALEDAMAGVNTIGIEVLRGAKVYG